MKTAELRAIKAHWLTENELEHQPYTDLFDEVLWGHRWHLFCSGDGLGGGRL